MMSFSWIFWLGLCCQIAGVSAVDSNSAPPCKSECKWKQAPRSLTNDSMSSSGSDTKPYWRFDVPGRCTDAVFKSPAKPGSEIALVREFRQDEHIPALSRDFHPDHRLVSHHQLYIQSNCSSSRSRVAIGPPIEGHCRPKHTYYMSTDAGDYILSSAVTFSEPNSVIKIFLTWTFSGDHHEISRLSYNHVNDCKVHHTFYGGIFVTSLPNFDCPWVAAVPDPTGILIASLNHSSSVYDPYQVDVRILVAAHNYTPCVFNTTLNFYNVRVESDMSYHWTNHTTFRIYGGNSAFQIHINSKHHKDFAVVEPISADRKAQILPRTSSSRISQTGESVLVLDRQNEFEPKEIPNAYRDKPFGFHIN